MPIKESDELEDEIVTTIFKFMSILRGKKSFGTVGTMTLSQLQCVIAIGDSNPTMATIASELELTMPTVSVTIDNLVKQNIVQRKRDEKDRRVVRVSLTPNGKKVKKKMKDKKTAILKMALDKLTISDRKKTQEVMQTLLKALEEN